MLLSFIFASLAATVCLLTFVFSQPKNIVVLFLCQALAMSTMPVLVFVGGMIAIELSASAALVTLPITLMVVGVACGTIPAAYLAKKFGRKSATIFGLTVAIAGSLTAVMSLYVSSFVFFCVASLAMGVSKAFIQQLRFAAIESTSDQANIPTTVSIMMVSGLFAAFTGPEVALYTRDLIDNSLPYTATFLVLAALAFAAILVMTLYRNTSRAKITHNDESRPLITIAKQPVFLISISAAVIGYALMSYLMTATPLSMHQLHSHDLNATKTVIQSHIAAMFLPSLITPFLVRRFGLGALLTAGSVLYAVVCCVAFAGHHVVHYWWCLVLLGIGWNFLFLVGTSLLPQCYKDSEKYKVQALNDFVLFGFQALASLFAGSVLFWGGWNAVVLSSFPFVLLLAVVCVAFAKTQRRA